MYGAVEATREPRVERKENPQWRRCSCAESHSALTALTDHAHNPHRPALIPPCIQLFNPRAVSFSLLFLCPYNFHYFGKLFKVFEWWWNLSGRSNSLGVISGPVWPGNRLAPGDGDPTQPPSALFTWPVTGVRAEGNPGISPVESGELAAWPADQPSPGWAFCSGQMDRRRSSLPSQQRSNTRDCRERIGTPTHNLLTIKMMITTVVERKTAYFDWIKGFLGDQLGGVWDALILRQNVKCHEISNFMKFQMSWIVKCQEMSNVRKCQMSWYVKCHEISNVLSWINLSTCQMSWNVKCHEISNVKCHEMSRHEMSHVMKCQHVMSCHHDFWHKYFWLLTQIFLKLPPLTQNESSFMKFNPFLLTAADFNWPINVFIP